jgi:hypothetical protein
MVAQQIEQCIQQVIPDSDRERMRLEYLHTHSPSRYAQEFLRVLQEVHQS